ncbi:TniQ family protein [Parashewanella tropica]|uniref:TniQ family protein n=1 Tax=Parashewanella tropica TaxID=2547970 RepID=UPI00105A7B2F|nr:TniQ family protein [Parashewanella tropica]
MTFLIRNRVFKDETLESYFIRLAHSNGFEKINLFLSSLNAFFIEYDIKLKGILPTALSRLNLYKAHNSSAYRVRAIKLLEEFCDLQPSSLLRVSVLRTNKHFGSYAALARSNVLFPNIMLREKVIPVCPECLQEKSYIRFIWHLKPIQHCPKHHVKLIFNCPECGNDINYIQNENVELCSCGFDFRQIKPPNKIEESMSASLFESPENAEHLSLEFGKYLWFSKRSGVELDDECFLLKFNRYFSNWPDNYLSYLKTQESNAIEKQTSRFNQISVNDIWRDQLRNVKLSSTDKVNNLVLEQLTNYFIDLVRRYPKCEHANVADTLINQVDSALLLRTSVEQVFRLLEDGYLRVKFGVPTEAIYKPHIPIFYLREVIELVQAQGANTTMSNHIISAW